MEPSRSLHLVFLLLVAVSLPAFVSAQGNQTIHSTVQPIDATVVGEVDPQDYSYVQVDLAQLLPQYSQNPVLTVSFQFTCGPTAPQLYALRGGFPTNTNNDKGAESVQVSANQTTYFYDVDLTDKQNPIIVGVYNPNAAAGNGCFYTLFIDLDEDITLDMNEVGSGVVQGLRWEFFKTSGVIPRGDNNTLLLVQTYHSVTCNPLIVAKPGNYPTEVDGDSFYMQHDTQMGFTSLIVTPQGLAFYPQSQWFIGVYLQPTGRTRPDPCSFSISVHVQPVLNITAGQSESHFIGPQMWNYFALSNGKDSKEELTVQLESLVDVDVAVYARADNFPSLAGYTAMMDCATNKCVISYDEEAYTHYIAIYNDNPITIANYTILVTTEFTEPEGEGLSGGAKFGIALAIILGVAVLAGLAWFAKKKFTHRTFESHPGGNYNQMHNQL